MAIMFVRVTVLACFNLANWCSIAKFNVSPIFLCLRYDQGRLLINYWHKTGFLDRYMTIKLIVSLVVIACAIIQCHISLLFVLSGHTLNPCPFIDLAMATHDFTSQAFPFLVATLEWEWPGNEAKRCLVSCPDLAQKEGRKVWGLEYESLVVHHQHIMFLVNQSESSSWPLAV